MNEILPETGGKETCLFLYLVSCPTSPFTILEPQNPWIGEFYVVQERRAMDFRAPNL